VGSQRTDEQRVARFEWWVDARGHFWRDAKEACRRSGTYSPDYTAHHRINDKGEEMFETPRGDGTRTPEGETDEETDTRVKRAGLHKIAFPGNSLLGKTEAAPVDSTLKDIFKANASKINDRVSKLDDQVNELQQQLEAERRKTRDACVERDLSRQELEIEKLKEQNAQLTQQLAEAVYVPESSGDEPMAAQKAYLKYAVLTWISHISEKEAKVRQGYTEPSSKLTRLKRSDLTDADLKHLRALAGAGAPRDRGTKKDPCIACFRTNHTLVQWTSRRLRFSNKRWRKTKSLSGRPSSGRPSRQRASSLGRSSRSLPSAPARRSTQCTRPTQVLPTRQTMHALAEAAGEADAAADVVVDAAAAG